MAVARQKLFDAERSRAMIRPDEHDIAEPVRDQLHPASDEGREKSRPATIFLFGLCWVRRLTARYSSHTMHKIRSDARRCAAVERESPKPVPTATYATRHAGHFGTSARIAPGTIQPAMSRQRGRMTPNDEIQRPALADLLALRPVRSHQADWIDRHPGSPEKSQFPSCSSAAGRWFSGSGMVQLVGVRASIHIQRLRPLKMTKANALGHNGIG